MKETKYIVPFENGRQTGGKFDQPIMIKVVKAAEINEKDINAASVLLIYDKNPKYLSVISYPTTGEILAVTDAIHFKDIKKILSRGKFYDLYNQIERFNTISFGFDGKLVYKSNLEIIENMLVARIYCFHNFKKNYGTGWYECCRIIFDENNVGYETRTKFDPKFELKAYKFKVEKCIKQKLNSAKNDREKEKISIDASILASGFYDPDCKSYKNAVKMYPYLFKNETIPFPYGDLSYFGLEEFLWAWDSIPHETRIFKYVPENIKKDLTIIHENIGTKSSYFKLYQENNLSCYFYESVNDKGTLYNGTRVYFTKDRMYLFRYNPCIGKYVSKKWGDFKRSFF